MHPVAASFVIVCQKVISGGSMCLCFFMPNIFAYVDKQSAVNRIYKGVTYKNLKNELFCKDFYTSALLYLQPF